MKFWTSDGRLDVVVLGPMKGRKMAGTALRNCELIEQVISDLLEETAIKKLLGDAGFSAPTVACPEGWEGPDIPGNVFLAIDQADLAVFDMSGASPKAPPSPNVMYELGMTHALGLPCVLIQKAGVPLPFYLSRTRHVMLNVQPYPDAKELKGKLRRKFKALFDPRDPASFDTNPISQHYDGAAVVDISAAMGLAVGYYNNFLHRLLVEPDYLKRRRARFKRIVTLLPNTFQSRADDQIADFKQLVRSAGLRAGHLAIAPPRRVPDIRPIEVDYIGSSLFDIPTTVFALKQSPRYITRQDRADKLAGTKAHDELARMEQRLLQQFGSSIAYLLRRADRTHGKDVSGRHLLARIPTSVEEVQRLFGRPAAKS